MTSGMGRRMTKEKGRDDVKHGAAGDDTKGAG